MIIRSSLTAAALALAFSAVPSLAHAQEPYGGWEPPVQQAPQPQPQQEFTHVRITPPPFGVIYLYDGRRLVGRFDRPGALWLPAGRTYRVVAMRGDQQIWNGWAPATLAPIELRWPQAGEPCSCSCPTPPANPYPTPPVEQGRTRTPLP
jgi:hypothetical protein